MAEQNNDRARSLMLLPNGIWISNPTPSRHGGPLLFLDRDGVIVHEVNYLARPKDVALETGIADLVSWVHGRGIAIAAVTNQSGIARGRFGWPEYEAVEAEVERQLAERGVAIDLVVACAFHVEHTEGFGVEHARWRKPGPAMLELAAERLGCDLEASVMIGDKASDVEAARNAGLAHAIHVLTGHGEEERAAALALARPGFEVHAAADLRDALTILKSGPWAAR